MTCELCKMAVGVSYETQMVGGVSWCDVCRESVTREDHGSLLYAGIVIKNGRQYHEFKQDYACPHCGALLASSLFYCQDDDPGSQAPTVHRAGEDESDQ